MIRPAPVLTITLGGLVLLACSSETALEGHASPDSDQPPGSNVEHAPGDGESLDGGLVSEASKVAPPPSPNAPTPSPTPPSEASDPLAELSQDRGGAGLPPPDDDLGFTGSVHDDLNPEFVVADQPTASEPPDDPGLVGASAGGQPPSNAPIGVVDLPESPAPRADPGLVAHNTPAPPAGVAGHGRGQPRGAAGHGAQTFRVTIGGNQLKEVLVDNHGKIRCNNGYTQSRCAASYPAGTEVVLRLPTVVTLVGRVGGCPAGTRMGYKGPWQCNGKKIPSREGNDFTEITLRMDRDYLECGAWYHSNAPGGSGNCR